MNFTFGIVTHKDSGNDITKVIDSIKNNATDDYEIIIIGGKHIEGHHIYHVPFDETLKNGWITKKKNLITHLASTMECVYVKNYRYKRKQI